MSRRGKWKRQHQAICDRSGMKFPYSEMVIEPGTGLFVHRSETDRQWNIVDHPQNHIRTFGPDPTPLIPARPDIKEDNRQIPGSIWPDITTYWNFWDKNTWENS